MSNHTPEPWIADGLTINGWSDNHPIHKGATNERVWVCQMITGTPSSEDYANAARIVACVNACRGLDIEKVAALLDAVRAEASTLYDGRNTIDHRNNVEARILASSALIYSYADSIRAGGGQ